MKRIFPVPVLAPVLAIAVGGCTVEVSDDGQTGQEERNTEIVLEVFEALGSDDLATLERYFARDGDVVIGLETRKRGGPYSAFAEAAPYPGALDNVTVAVEKILAEDDAVAIQSRICGDHAAPLLGFAPTGKQVCARYLNLYVLKDGMIVSNTVGVLRDQLRAQLEANSG